MAREWEKERNPLYLLLEWVAIDPQALSSLHDGLHSELCDVRKQSSMLHLMMKAKMIETKEKTNKKTNKRWRCASALSPFPWPKVFFSFLLLLICMYIQKSYNFLTRIIKPLDPPEGPGPGFVRCSTEGPGFSLPPDRPKGPNFVRTPLGSVHVSAYSGELVNIRSTWSVLGRNARPPAWH